MIKLGMLVGQWAKEVLVDFGTPVHSLGMTRAQAVELGRTLINKAGYACCVSIDESTRQQRKTGWSSTRGA